MGNESKLISASIETLQYHIIDTWYINFVLNTLLLNQNICLSKASIDYLLSEHLVHNFDPDLQRSLHEFHANL